MKKLFIILLAFCICFSTYAESPSKKCYACQSENIIREKKGFRGGYAILGAVLLGPVGLVAGAVNSNDYWYICEDCGFKWDLEDVREGFIKKNVEIHKKNNEYFHNSSQSNDTKHNCHSTECKNL